MKPAIAALGLLVFLPFATTATGQQHYTFEEACRNAGMTTGACAPKVKQAQPECIKLDGFAFHAEKFAGDCIPTISAPVFDVEILVELVGLANVEKVNQLKLRVGRAIDSRKNAHAGFYKGDRMIIFDHQWARAGTAESYLILGHEIGHHFCGHTLKSYEGAPREKELEADRFAGASIKRFEVYHGRPFLDDAIKAGARLFAEDHRGYPTRAARLEAVRLGYKSGSPCGSLAPGIPGYSPQPR